MSPSQRRDVREQFRRNIETILAAQVDSLTKVERVPVDDNGREQIEPCDPIMLAFAGPIPDLALTADAQRILEGVMRFAFVEADLRPSLHVSIKDPVDQEQRTLDPAYLAQRQSQVVLPGIGRQFAKQLAGVILPPLTVATLRNRSGQLATTMSLRILPATSFRSSVGVPLGSKT